MSTFIGIYIIVAVLYGMLHIALIAQIKPELFECNEDGQKSGVLIGLAVVSIFWPIHMVYTVINIINKSKK